MSWYDVARDMTRPDGGAVQGDGRYVPPCRLFAARDVTASAQASDRKGWARHFLFKIGV
jgi:hypothetical protein